MLSYRQRQEIVILPLNKTEEESMVRHPKRRQSRQRHLWFAVWNGDALTVNQRQSDIEPPAKVSSR